LENHFCSDLGAAHRYSASRITISTAPAPYEPQLPPHTGVVGRPRQLLVRRRHVCSTRSACSRCRPMCLIRCCSLSMIEAVFSSPLALPLLCFAACLALLAVAIAARRAATPECPSCRSERCHRRCPCGLHPRATLRRAAVHHKSRPKHIVVVRLYGCLFDGRPPPTLVSPPQKLPHVHEAPRSSSQRPPPHLRPATDGAPLPLCVVVEELPRLAPSSLNPSNRFIESSLTSSHRRRPPGHQPPPN
jgi:hypothetical protein